MGETRAPGVHRRRLARDHRVNLLEALALGLVIGLSLGALGGGGSILTVPALVYVPHQHAQAATTGSLVIVGITALVGSIGTPEAVT